MISGPWSPPQSTYTTIGNPSGGGRALTAAHHPNEICAFKVVIWHVAPRGMSGRCQTTNRHPAVVILQTSEFISQRNLCFDQCGSAGLTAGDGTVTYCSDVTVNRKQLQTCDFRVLWSSLRILQFLSWSSDSLIFMETEGSLPYSQQLACVLQPDPC
jgi:hypothetical protein